MKSEVKQRWIDALENGDYPQTRGCLLEQDCYGDCSYCALGVLVDLYVRDTNAEWQLDTDDGFGYMNGYYMTLPPEVAEWAGISEDDRHLIEIADDGVVGMNDSYGKSFGEIAGFIKEKL